MRSEAFMNGGARPVVAATIAALVGGAVGAIFGGGKLVKMYDWTTEWQVDAPRADVFALFSHPEDQSLWWPSMIVERSSPPEAEVRSVTYRVVQAPSVRRFAPPFRITSTQTDVEHERRIRAVVTGDLAGVLDTLLFDGPNGGTWVMFHWYVRVTNPLLNVAGYVATPVFRASHDHVMHEGEAGLQRYFAEQDHTARTLPVSNASVGKASEQG
jgi:uncharacterized protein YndB with AHSA1/START domain